MTIEEIMKDKWAYIFDAESNFENKKKGHYIRKITTTDGVNGIEISDPMGDVQTYDTVENRDSDWDKLILGEKPLEEVFEYRDSGTETED